MKTNEIEDTNIRVRLEQMLIALRTARHGELIGLKSVYESFNRPQGKSPRGVFGKTEILKALQAFQSKYPEENLIDYRKDGIYVNYHLFDIYLRVLVADTDKSEDTWLEILALYKKKYDSLEEETKILQGIYKDFNYSPNETGN